MAKLVLTVIGDDRPGLVAALADQVTRHAGNWLESQLARLGGKFAGIVLVDVADVDVPALTRSLDSLADRVGLKVSSTQTPEEPAGPVEPSGPAPTQLMSLHLLGLDRPGIVSEISRTLTDRAASIEELRTATFAAPMGGGVLFEADARVRLPVHADVTELREALEALAAELMVDLELHLPE
jgi:glycine cleavage system regulatory protein